jgi:glyoxylase-like metal-dependent hydrolase (beta-lactamase superfamily II)
VPQSAFGPALNEQGYYVGRVERNLYWITDGTYQCAFLTTSDGVVVLDAPPTIGNNIQRAVDEIAAANGVSNKVEYLIYSHHHSDHVGAASCFATTIRPGLRTRRHSRTAARWRSAASGSTSPGTAPTTRPTTSSSTCPTTMR